MVMVIVTTTKHMSSSNFSLLLVSLQDKPLQFGLLIAAYDNEKKKKAVAFFFSIPLERITYTCM